MHGRAGIAPCRSRPVPYSSRFRRKWFFRLRRPAVEMSWNWSLAFLLSGGSRLRPAGASSHIRRGTRPRRTWNRRSSTARRYSWSTAPWWRSSRWSSPATPAASDFRHKNYSCNSRWRRTAGTWRQCRSESWMSRASSQQDQGRTPENKPTGPSEWPTPSIPSRELQ